MGDIPVHYATLRSPWERVVAVAQRQWGVASLAQIVDCGVADATVRAWVRRGRLIRLHRGVYAVGHAQLRAEGFWLAAVLACGEGAALAGRSAAAHLGIRTVPGGKIEVAVPRGRRGPSTVRAHRPRALPPQDVAIVDAIPTTTATRTLRDLRRSLSLDDFENTVARAVRRGLVTEEEGQLLAGGRPQLTRARAERRFLRAVRAAGLPEPEMNAWLTHGGGEEWEADVLWRAPRVIVEVDDGSHRTPRAFERDRLKDAARQADGYATLRFTTAQLAADTPKCLALVARTLAGRRSVA